jgi:hypothetical protein
MEVAYMLCTILLSRHARPHGGDGSDMSFTVVILIFTILTGIAGSLLANHYSVYALAPVTFFFLALAAAGCVVYGANLSGSAITALSGVIRLFASALRPTKRVLKLKRAQQDDRPQRPGGRDGDAWAIGSAERRLINPRTRCQYARGD